MAVTGRGEEVTRSIPPPVGGLPAGTRIQDYCIKSVVGEGGFAIVYLADDVLLHREVAIKEYMPASLAVRNARQGVEPRSASLGETFSKGLHSFINEARMLAQFKHRALIDVLRFWEENGTAYMAMPYYRGKTLRDIFREPGFHCDEAWLRRLIDPLLSGLQEMHREDCFHRDISTDNIIVLGDGSPVLLDFGAARRIVAAPDQLATIILKPGFAPIEQYSDDINAAPQGPWTDIYALCAVCYFAVSGRMPTTSVARIMRDPLAPLTSLNLSGYSHSFLAAIDKGLAVHPQDRPQSIQEFAALLDLPSPAKPVAPAEIVPPVQVVEAASVQVETVDPVPKEPPAPETAIGAASSWVTDILAETGDSAQQGIDALLADDTKKAEISEPQRSSSKDKGKTVDLPSPTVLDAKQASSEGVVPEKAKSGKSTAGKPREKKRSPIIAVSVAAIAVLLALAGYFSGVFRSSATPNDSALVASEGSPGMKIEPQTSGVTPISVPSSVATEKDLPKSPAVSGEEIQAGSNSAERKTDSKNPEHLPGSQAGNDGNPSLSMEGKPLPAVQPPKATSPEPISPVLNAGGEKTVKPTKSVVTDPSGGVGNKPKETNEPVKEPIEPARPKPGNTAVKPSPEPKSAAPVVDRAENKSADTGSQALGKGAVDIQVKPWGRIAVDGKPQGVSPPLRRLWLPVGKHSIVITNPHGAYFTTQINVSESGVVQVVHDFTASQAGMR